MNIVIGTAQFGLQYGITNQNSFLTQSAIEEILDFSLANGVNMIDTSPAYGTSEHRLGLCDLNEFKIITKVTSQTPVTASLDASLKTLNIEQLYGLLLHDENDAANEQAQEKFAALRAAKKQGKVKKIGVSFYTPELALEVMHNFEGIDLIQIPANHLDCRFEKQGILKLAQEKGIEVHIRSLFLQGLLAVEPHRRPDEFQAHPDLLKYDRSVQENKCLPTELALSYLNKHDDNYGVIGCSSLPEFKAVLASFKKVTSNAISAELPNLSSSDEYLINPSRWGK